MSVNALEKALWQIYLTPADAERYKADAQGYAQEFNLDDGERQDLVSLDVMALQRRGVNALLVMMVHQTVMGIERLFEYFEIVNQAEGENPAA